MTPREAEQLVELRNALRKTLTESEHLAGKEGGYNYGRALGRLQGTVDYVLARLDAMIPVTHPTCVRIINSDEDLACGERVIEDRCPIHGATWRSQ